jgi:hypothetical protein
MPFFNKCWNSQIRSVANEMIFGFNRFIAREREINLIGYV